LGIPVHDLQDAKRIDVFQFADLALSPKVAFGFHALAIDEQRGDFVPTLWDPRDGVVQRWFCGAHSDVGGGGSPTNYFSASSLRWMIARLASRGVLFAPAGAEFQVPQVLGPVHASYLDPPFDLRPHAPRLLPPDVLFHPSVQNFLANFSPYVPESLHDWLRGASGRELDPARLSE